VKIVVITGSTRGIGFGLADAFLELGNAVVICGRSQDSVEAALARLAAIHGAERILGHACDISHLEQVQGLWNTTQAHFGQVDIWINNAGLSHPRAEFWKQPPELVQAVVDTNLTGTMYGCQVALRGMLAQGFGALYNMEGLGSDGRQVAGMTLYSTTKYGLKYLTDALVEETKDTLLLVGALSPGMVLTDMLIREQDERSDADWQAAKRMFNILADRVEDVTPWLARQVLANDKSGARIKWLTRGRIMVRFLTAPFRKRDLFEQR
jgi:NAD(P)-dependent dehydrogenase (short-subunit alcohol dehydrogenase family)